MDLLKFYEALLKEYGPQGWWPVGNGFRPKEWEICVGAILTQNTAWKNVERGLKNLRDAGIMTPEALIALAQPELETLIRPTGFYRQKAERLKIFTDYLLRLGIKDFLSSVTRDELLALKGIGRETADSILLYACKKPVFIIDAYTRRIFSRLKLAEENAGYDELQDLFHKNLPRDVALFQEYHALIVRLGKEICGGGCKKCFLCSMTQK